MPMAERTSRHSILRGMFAGIPAVADRQAVLLRANETPRRAFLIVSGWAFRERLLPDGRRAILELYLPGDLVGLDDLFVERVPDCIVALTAMAYQAIGRDELERRFKENPETALAVLSYVADEKQRQYRHAARLARLTAFERSAASVDALCKRLSAIGAKHDQHGRPMFRLPLSQQQLADYLGLNVIHLNRTLRALRESGVIKIENGALLAEDMGRLNAFARDDLV
jgi:CRP-like cAMP-binding protein